MKTYLLLLLLSPGFVQTANAVDIVVDDGPREVHPSIPFQRPPIPPLPLRFRYIFPDGLPSCSNSFYIALDEALVQDGKVVPPPTDNGGHIGHDEQRRKGAALSFDSNPNFVRYLGLSGNNICPDGLPFYFFPPEISGTYRISVSQGGYYDRPLIVEIRVRVPGLI